MGQRDGTPGRGPAISRAGTPCADSPYVREGGAPAMCTALKMFNPGAASANARETAISWSFRKKEKEDQRRVETSRACLSIEK